MLSIYILACDVRTVTTDAGVVFTLPITRIDEIGYSRERCFQGKVQILTITSKIIALTIVKSKSFNSLFVYC